MGRVRRARPVALVGCLVAAALVFGGALLAAVSSPTDALDRSTSHAVAGFTSSRPAWVSVVRTYTDLGSTVVLVIVVVIGVLVLTRQRRRQAAVVFVLTCAVGELVTTLIKLAVHRARPPDRIVRAIGYSFPSGHTTNSTVVYGMVVLVVLAGARRSVRVAGTVAGILLVLGIGASRVLLNAHWVSDVIGGLALGSIVLCMTFTVERRLSPLRVAERDGADPPGPGGSHLFQMIGGRCWPGATAVGRRTRPDPRRGVPYGVRAGRGTGGRTPGGRPGPDRLVRPLQPDDPVRP